MQAGDEFILNGRKTFISGAPFADYAVVYAKTDPSQKGSKGISMFLVDMKLPGVSCGKPEHKMGIVGYYHDWRGQIPRSPPAGPAARP